MRCLLWRFWENWPRYNGTALYVHLTLWSHGPLARYIKLWVVYAPGMPGTFSPPPRVSDHVRHARAVVHAGVAWEKRSRYSWRMCNPQFDVSGKRPMVVFASLVAILLAPGHHHQVICRWLIIDKSMFNYFLWLIAEWRIYTSVN